MKLKLDLEIELDDDLLTHIEIDIAHAISYWGYPQRNPETGRIIIADRDCFDMANAPVCYPLPVDWVALGLKRLVEAKKPARHAMAIIKGEYDGENVDCLVQMAIFNELRYG